MIAAGDCPKGDIQAVPAIDSHNCQRQVRQFFLAEVLADLFIDLIMPLG
jgi:hypothetical protein